MRITAVHLKNVRCFQDQKIIFESPITLIEGCNGSGKTSILESLHYACYLRSFRTHTPRELVQFGAEAGSIKLEGYSNSSKNSEIQKEPLVLQVGFTGSKRKIRANGKAVGSYKELLDLYRVVTIIEEDVMLIKGAPELRRSFMDQALFLIDPAHADLMKRYKKVVKQRNALLAAPRCDRESYAIWTEQLTDLTTKIQTSRTQLLQELETCANKLVGEFFGAFNSPSGGSSNLGDDSHEITLSYKPKPIEDQLFEKERLFKRSLFGAHLDDCTIFFRDRASKQYASRGQQKLVAMILKIAQLRLLQSPAIVLIDDFMTDFDHKRIELFLKLLTATGYQLVFTCPLAHSPLAQGLSRYSYQTIQLKTPVPVQPLLSTEKRI